MGPRMFAAERVIDSRVDKSSTEDIAEIKISRNQIRIRYIPQWNREESYHNERLYLKSLFIKSISISVSFNSPTIVVSIGFFHHSGSS